LYKKYIQAAAIFIISGILKKKNEIFTGNVYFTILQKTFTIYTIQYAERERTENNRQKRESADE